MANRVDAQDLSSELRSCFPEWHSGEPTFVASGLEASVFRVTTACHGPLALKVFASHHIQNDNDTDLDARDLLRQDQQAFVHLQSCGLPAPCVVGLHVGRVSFLAYHFVETDELPCPASSIGRLVGILHRAGAPGFLPVAHRGNAAFEPVAAALIDARLTAVRRLAKIDLPSVDASTWERCLTMAKGPRTLLHMDVRQANFLCRSGRVQAWIDWSNAIIAHPVFEMARIVEYGLNLDEVLAGYGNDPRADVRPATWIAARVYTAAMLAVVHLSEAPDPARAEVAVAHLAALLDQFQQEMK
jgi:aminoglycoside phosphotransferase (APT) family kinase protein